MNVRFVSVFFSILLAIALTSCSARDGHSALPSVEGPVAQSAGLTMSPDVTHVFTEYKPPAHGVTGGIALGYDNAVWFTQNSSYVGRFLNGAFSSVPVNISEFNFMQQPAFPFITATTQGVYTGVEMDEEQGFAVEERIVQITYARHVSATNGEVGSFVNGFMGGIASGGTAVYATGSYNDGSNCTSCLYLMSASGQSKQRTKSYETGDAVAYLNGTVWLAAAESSSNGVQTAVQFDKVNPSTFAFSYVASVPSPSKVLGMTAGPDNAIWFTDAGRNAIGRVDALGHKREFTLPTANAQPNGITRGADGALWFTETHADKIGRITTAGIISEFHVPTANASPAGITALPVSSSGPRALWFAEKASGKIGRFTY